MLHDLAEGTNYVQRSSWIFTFGRGIAPLAAIFFSENSSRSGSASVYQCPQIREPNGNRAELWLILPVVSVNNGLVPS